MDHIALLLLASFIVGLSKGGLSTAGALAVPILSIWMNPLVAAGWLLPIFMISDCVGVWLYRRDFSTKNVLLLIPAGIFGVLIATILAPYISATIAIALTGLIGLFYCAQAWHRHLRGIDKAVPFQPVKGIFWGMITGITSFISHTGGPPYQSFVLPQKLPKLQFAGTTTLVFAAINFSKLPAYLSVGLMAPINWGVLLIMSGVAIAGVVFGRRLSIWMPEKLFFLIIQILLLIISIYLIGKAITLML